MFIFPVELPQAGRLLYRGNLFTLEELESAEALLSSLMSCQPFPFWVSGVLLMKVLTFIVCVLPLFSFLCLPFFPPSFFPLFPTLGEIYLLYLLAAAALGQYPGLRARWGHCPCSSCLALPCAVSLTPGEGFLGEIPFPWRRPSSHGSRQSNVGKGLEPFGD